MKSHEFIGLSCKVRQLAWLNWVKDGRPLGLDAEYWLAAESLLAVSEGEIPEEAKPELRKLKPARAAKSLSGNAAGSPKKLQPRARRGSKIESPGERMAL
jgi:hypothetical protein